MVAILRAPSTGSRADRYNFSRDGDAVIEAGLHRWYPEREVTITGVLSSAGVAPGGGDLEFDLMLDAFEVVPGGSLYTTAANRPKIPAGSFDDLAVAPDVAVIAVGQYVTVDTLAVGTAPAGSKIDVSILYE